VHTKVIIIYTYCGRKGLPDGVVVKADDAPFINDLSACIYICKIWLKDSLLDARKRGVRTKVIT
jgi:hypothetical protein